MIEQKTMEKGHKRNNPSKSGEGSKSGASKSGEGSKSDASFDWKLPLLSGQNLEILLKECEKRQEKGIVSGKKKKFTPNLSHTRKLKSESRDEFLDIDDNDSSSMPAESSKFSNVPKPSVRKQNYIQSEGLNIFSAENKGSIRKSNQFGKSNFDLDDEDYVKQVIDMLHDEDRKPLDFKRVYEESKFNEESTPVINLPVSLPYCEESKKSIYQKIQEIEAPEDYESMYLNCREFSKALNLESDDGIVENDLVQSFLVQTSGFVPALIEREPKHIGEENIVITDKMGLPMSGFKGTYKDLPEGQIGTLQIMKSGKMKLKLGKCDFWLTRGMDTGIKEDIMIINHNPDEKFGTLCTAGEVEGHIFTTPDFLMDDELNIFK